MVTFGLCCLNDLNDSWQIRILPKPKLRAFWVDSLSKPHFAQMIRINCQVIICDLFIP